MKTQDKALPASQAKPAGRRDPRHILNLSQIASDNYIQLNPNHPVELGTEKCQLLSSGLWALQRKAKISERAEGDLRIEF